MALGIAAMLGVSALSAAPAAAAVFVDATLGDVKPEQKVVIAHPQPVQLLFQFRTKGSPNAQAGKLLKPDVLAAVKASGLFSDVSDQPVAGGAILNVVIDDVVDPAEAKAAAGQGFATGLTLGLAGSTVREHYTSSLDYMASADAPKITRTATHYLLVQMGLINSTPPNAVKVDGGIKGGVSVIARQIVANPLNAIAGDPAFAPAATSAPTTPAPATPAPDAPAQPAPAAPAPAL